MVLEVRIVTIGGAGVGRNERGSVLVILPCYPNIDYMNLFSLWKYIKLYIHDMCTLL